MKEMRFKSVRKWVHLLISQNKMNRIAQRPLLVAVSEVDKMIRSIKSCGKDAGFVFPVEAPLRKVLSSTPVKDHTSYASADPFPIPEFVDIFEGCSEVPEEQAAIIEENWNNNKKLISEFQQNVCNNFVKLYDIAADASVKLDDYLTFYFSLAAHNDATQLDEARAVLSAIFKPEVRPYVLGEFESVEDKKSFKKADGLFGGDVMARQRIKSGVRSDAILEKSILYGSSSKKRFSFEEESREPDKKHFNDELVDDRNYEREYNEPFKGKFGGGRSSFARGRFKRPYNSRHKERRKRGYSSYKKRDYDGHEEFSKDDSFAAAHVKDHGVKKEEN